MVSVEKVNRTVLERCGFKDDVSNLPLGISWKIYAYMTFFPIRQSFDFSHRVLDLENEYPPDNPKRIGAFKFTVLFYEIRNKQK